MFNIILNLFHKLSLNITCQMFVCLFGLTSNFKTKKCTIFYVSTIIIFLIFDHYLLLQIVTEKTPLNGDYVGINLFGRTGNYGHMILKKHNKLKKKIYAKDENFDDKLLRLIFVSGRTEAGVKKSIKTVCFFFFWYKLYN